MCEAHELRTQVYHFVPRSGALPLREALGFVIPQRQVQQNPVIDETLHQLFQYPCIVDGGMHVLGMQIVSKDYYRFHGLRKVISHSIFMPLWKDEEVLLGKRIAILTSTRPQ
jgi:hypothetical protein